MDKNTLSNYGWIVVAVLVLSVMIALATPFGHYVELAAKNTLFGLIGTSDNALEVVTGNKTSEPSTPETKNGFQYGVYYHLDVTDENREFMDEYFGIKRRMSVMFFEDGVVAFFCDSEFMHGEFNAIVDVENNRISLQDFFTAEIVDNTLHFSFIDDDGTYIFTKDDSAIYKVGTLKGVDDYIGIDGHRYYYEYHISDEAREDYAGLTGMHFVEYEYLEYRPDENGLVTHSEYENDTTHDDRYNFNEFFYVDGGYVIVNDGDYRYLDGIVFENTKTGESFFGFHFSNFVECSEKVLNVDTSSPNLSYDTYYKANIVADDNFKFDTLLEVVFYKDGTYLIFQDGTFVNGGYKNTSYNNTIRKIEGMPYDTYVAGNTIILNINNTYYTLNKGDKANIEYSDLVVRHQYEDLDYTYRYWISDETKAKYESANMTYIAESVGWAEYDGDELSFWNIDIYNDDNRTGERVYLAEGNQDKTVLKNGLLYNTETNEILGIVFINTENIKEFHFHGICHTETISQPK